MRWAAKAKGLTRRHALAGLAAIGGGAVVAHGAFSTTQQSGMLPGNACVLTPEAVEGPFYFDPRLVRADITEDRPGVPLKLTLQLVEAKDCAKLARVRVDIWHADGEGAYSGYDRQETGSTKGQTFLRGTQVTDADGQVSFTTIYPGWYPGRAPHIHFKVLLDAASALTGQLYFPDAVSDQVYAEAAPYRERKGSRDTNATDSIFKDENGAATTCTIEQDGSSYAAALLIGVDRA
jgi:protocatechuate 3,4-dioxygenase beta subunit